MFPTRTRVRVAAILLPTLLSSAGVFLMICPATTQVKEYRWMNVSQIENPVGKVRRVVGQVPSLPSATTFPLLLRPFLPPPPPSHLPSLLFSCSPFQPPLFLFLFVRPSGRKCNTHAPDVALRGDSSRLSHGTPLTGDHPPLIASHPQPDLFLASPATRPPPSTPPLSLLTTNTPCRLACTPSRCQVETGR